MLLTLNINFQFGSYDGDRNVLIKKRGQATYSELRRRAEIQ